MDRCRIEATMLGNDARKTSDDADDVASWSDGLKGTSLGALARSVHVLVDASWEVGHSVSGWF